MLDYAANGVVYWPAERLRADFETRCAVEGKDAGAAEEWRPEPGTISEGKSTVWCAVGRKR